MHQAEQIHKLFGIILHRFVSSFPFIYSTIHLCQCKHMDIYCILWVINQCNFFFLCSSHSSFGHWELSIGSCVPLSYTDNYVLVCFPFEIVFSIFFFFYFGALLDAPCSTCIYPAPVLQSVFSPRSPGYQKPRSKC